MELEFKTKAQEDKTPIQNLREILIKLENQENPIIDEQIISNINIIEKKTRENNQNLIRKCKYNNALNQAAAMINLLKSISKHNQNEKDELSKFILFWEQQHSLISTYISSEIDSIEAITRNQTVFANHPNFYPFQKKSKF